MFKNKKGFTLVELLSTIAILAIVLGIVSAAYVGITKHLKASFYKTLEESILVSGGEYYAYTSDRPVMFGDEKSVSLKDLVENKYSTDIVDRKGNQCNLDTSYVGAYKDSYDKTNYYVCLTCDGDSYTSDKPECSGNIGYSLQVTATVNDTNKVYQVNNWVNSYVKLTFKTLNNVEKVYVKDNILGTSFNCTMTGTSIKTCSINVDKSGNYEYYGISSSNKETKHGHINIKVDTTNPRFDVYEDTTLITSDSITKNITSNSININATVKDIVDSDSKVQSIRYSFEKQGSSKNYVTIDNNLTEFNITKNLELGKYKLEIEIKDYAGNVNTRTITYQINKSVAKPDSSYCNDLTYNGYEQTLTKTPGEGYTFTNNKKIDAGSYEIIIVLKDNYAFSDGSTPTLTCTLNKKEISVNWGSTTTFTYNGSAQGPTVTATSGVSGETLNIIRTTETNAGSYTSTASISSVSGGRANKNNYILTGNTKYFTINKANPTITLSATSGSVNAGSTITFTEKASIDGSFSNVSGTTSVATISPTSYSSVAANTAKTVTITGVSNGSSTITVTFTPTDTKNYNQETATYTVTGYKVASVGTCPNKTYNGSSQTLASGGTGVEYSNNNRTNYGSQTVTVSLKSGYRWSNGTTANKTLNCSISKKSVTIKADNQTITYGSSIRMSTSYITTTGLVSGHSVTSINLSQSTTNVTTSGTITPSGAVIKSGSTVVTSNYSISYKSGTLVINRSPTATIGSCQNVTYNGLEQAIASGGSNVTYSNNLKTDAGTYTVTVNANSNYTFSNGSTSTTLDCAISKKTVAVNWGSTTTFTYNGGAQGPTATATSGVSGETLNVIRTTETNAGSYTSTASISSVSGGRANKNNYTLTGNTKDFTISKKSVTITAKSQTISFGDNIGTGTSYITTTGLVSGHSVTSINLNQSTTNVTTSGTITPSGAVIKSGSTEVTSNYSISYQNGTLIITKPEPPTVSISISGESYSSGYKSGAVATATCTSADGISSFDVTNNKSKTFSTTGDSYTKTATATYDGSTSGWQITITCTGVNGESASTTATYKIYEYSRDSACSCETYNCSCTCKYEVGSGLCTGKSSKSTTGSSCSSACSTKCKNSLGSSYCGYKYSTGSCSQRKKCWHT